MNISKACELFLSYSQYTKDLSPLTIKAYKQDLSLLKELTGEELAVKSITREIVKECVNSLFAKGHSKATVKRRLACYKSLFKWLENEEIIKQTPFYRLDLKVKLPLRLPRNLTHHELKTMYQAAKQQVAFDIYNSCEFSSSINMNQLSIFLALELLLTTGVRVSELTQIQLNDIHLTDRYIHIRGKGERERRVFITNKNIHTFLEKYIRFRLTKNPDHSTLLINKLSNPATTQTIRIWMRKLSEHAKLDRKITPHMYRHSAATNLIEAGVDIRYVQKLLGHQSITTTQIYTHLNNTELYKTIAKANIQGKLL